MTEIKKTTEAEKKVPPLKESYIDFKGLKLYTAILASLIGSYVYMQVKGIALYKDSNTQHEGNQHIYSNGHHK